MTMAPDKVHDSLDSAAPNYIEFRRMQGPKEALGAVRQFFGSPYATLEHFTEHFSIDLNQFSGFYLEVGATDSPQGPLVPGKVKPILVLKQSRSGKTYTPKIMNHEGFMTLNGEMAWVDAVAWDQHVQDTFVEEVKEAERKRRALLAKQQAATEKAEADAEKA
jgi:hypothetical protein